ncbi:MAG: hypothetical protein KDD62_07465, partial [Bdellovibrionales bacterium]|nr:hypothetical protein [Bdellovibrionales bacterium]
WDFEAIDDAHISRDEIYNSFEQRKLLLEDQFPGITLPMPHKESIPEAIHQHTTTLSARLTPDEMLTLIKYELEHRSNCPPELRDSVAQDILEQSVQNRERRIKKFEHMIEQAEDRIQRSRKIAWLGTGAMVLYTPYLALQALRLNAALFQPQISSGLNANFVADVMVSAIVVGAFVAGILTSRSLIRSANAQINQLQESLNKML